MAYRLPARHQEVNWREFTLWSILFFGIYLFYPFSFLVGDRSYIPLTDFPYLPDAITTRLLAIVPLILTYFIVVYMSERYILLAKGERPTALLYITALTLTQPELTFLRGCSLLLMTLILFTSFGEEGRSEAPFPYFTTGLMIGILCLVHPIYLLVVLCVLRPYPHTTQCAGRPTRDRSPGLDTLTPTLRPLVPGGAGRLPHLCLGADRGTSPHTVPLHLGDQYRLCTLRRGALRPGESTVHGALPA